MSSKKTLISTAVGSAFAASLGAAPAASAAENPFAMQSLDQGYMLAQAGKMGDGKCGMGKCGGTMMDENKDGKISKEEFTKYHDAVFATTDVNKDGFIDKDEMGKPGGAKKPMEGNCGGMKAPMGKCGGMK
jgi:uncharacterized low-complexity protein